MNKSRILLIVLIALSVLFVGAFITIFSTAFQSNDVNKVALLLASGSGLVVVVLAFFNASRISILQVSNEKALKDHKDLLESKEVTITSLSSEIKENNLLNERVSELSVIIQEADEINVAANAVLESIAKQIDICQGVLYVTQEESDSKYLKGAGTYAYHKPDASLDQPKFGVGLVGQAALEQKSLYINELPSGYIDVISGLGKAQPSYLALIPLLYSGEVLGVMELASFQEFTEKDKEMFEAMKQSLGAGIHFLIQARLFEELLDENKRLKAMHPTAQIEAGLDDSEKELGDESVKFEDAALEETESPEEEASDDNGIEQELD